MPGSRFWVGSSYDRQQRIAESSQWCYQAPALILYLAARQFATPTSDISAGNWTTDSGATINLFASVDETVRDDSDYIHSEQHPSSSPVTLGIDAALATPNSGPQYLRYTYGKDGVGAQVDITVELLEDASVFQTWTHTDVPVGFTPATQQITNAISNYGNLRVRFTATQV